MAQYRLVIDNHQRTFWRWRIGDEVGGVGPVLWQQRADPLHHDIVTLQVLTRKGVAVAVSLEAGRSIRR